MKHNMLIEEIDAILPQTQCRRCGFSGCLPYAEAIAEERADINQCPPGGDEGIRKLAELLGKHPLPLDPAHGVYQPPRMVALVNEEACIGCTLCIQACPVDAIVGAIKQMHTVIAAECTGCELCVAPCPMDCISMIPKERLGCTARNQLDNTSDGSSGRDDKAAADHARKRYRYRLQRLEQEKREKEGRMAHKSEAVAVNNSSSVAEDRKKAAIQAALARARAARASTARTQEPAKT